MWLSTRKRTIPPLSLPFFPLCTELTKRKLEACGVEYLEGILKEEQTNGEFSDLPRDYLEVSKVLIDAYVSLSLSPPLPSLGALLPPRPELNSLENM